MWERIKASWREEKRAWLILGGMGLLFGIMWAGPKFLGEAYAGEFVCGSLGVLILAILGGVIHALSRERLASQPGLTGDITIDDAPRQSKGRIESGGTAAEFVRGPQESYGGRFRASLKEQFWAVLRVGGFFLLLALAMVAGKLIWPTWQYAHIAGLAILGVLVAAFFFVFALVNK